MFEVGLLHYVVLATILFILGLFGVLMSRNVIRVLMSLELMLNAVNINFVAFNNFLSPHQLSVTGLPMFSLSGQVFAIFILTVSAAEAAVGLAIVIAMYRARSTVDMEKFDLLKW